MITAAGKRWIGAVATVVLAVGVLVGITGQPAAAAIGFVSYPVNTPVGMATGPDGNVWFTGASVVGRITPAGVITTFAAGITPNSGAYVITAGPDGNLWFTETATGGKIGRITPAGVVTEFGTGLSPNALLRGITAGPDGNLWFTSWADLGTPSPRSIVGRITPTGTITEFTAGLDGHDRPSQLTTGPDGNLWVSLENKIARVTPSGVVTTFGSGLSPYSITTGPDGALWFAEETGGTGKLGRITTSGAITEFPFPGSSFTGPIGLVTGPDGALWFTEMTGNKLGRMTTAGVVTEYPVGPQQHEFQLQDLVVGADGNFWFASPGSNAIIKAGEGVGAGPDGNPTTTTTASTTTTTLAPGTQTDAFGNPTPQKPVGASVSAPQGGAVTINEKPAQSSTPAVPSTYRAIGTGFVIDAPPASAAAPLNLTFSVLPQDGVPDSSLTVFRDGVAVADCRSATAADPDPCVGSRDRVGNSVRIAVRSSHASTWDVASPIVGRLAGADRVATAIEVSKAVRPVGGAPGAVLARSDSFADALAGGPLAKAKDGALLLTPSDRLPAAVGVELRRSVAQGGTVYVLGGEQAISKGVASSVAALGFKVQRIAGTDRYVTAVEVANALGNPSAIALATGTGFADALAAGPVVAGGGAVLLTAGRSLPPAVADYLKAHPAVPTYAIGGEAAAAAPNAERIAGTDRYDTAAKVAIRFFPSATRFGLASGASFADALSSVAFLAQQHLPLLLTPTTSLPASVGSFLKARKATILGGTVFGGATAVPDAVRAAAVAALTG